MRGFMPAIVAANTAHNACSHQLAERHLPPGIAGWWWIASFKHVRILFHNPGIVNAGAGLWKSAISITQLGEATARLISFTRPRGDGAARRVFVSAAVPGGRLHLHSGFQIRRSPIGAGNPRLAQAVWMRRRPEPTDYPPVGFSEMRQRNGQ